MPVPTPNYCHIAGIPPNKRLRSTTKFAATTSLKIMPSSPKNLARAPLQSLQVSSSFVSTISCRKLDRRRSKIRILRYVAQKNKRRKLSCGEGRCGQLSLLSEVAKVYGSWVKIRGRRKNYENRLKSKIWDFEMIYLTNRSMKSQSVFFYTEYEWRATTFVYKVFEDHAWFEIYGSMNWVKQIKEEEGGTLWGSRPFLK